MNDNEIDIPLLRKAVEWVETEAARPKDTRTWFQGGWITDESFRVKYYGATSGCGSAYCVAGYIGQLVDERFALDAPGHNNLGWYHSGEPDGIHVSTVAQKALGLTDRQAEDLFRANNTAEEIRELAEFYAGEPL